jgi:hypothetical protein
VGGGLACMIVVAIAGAFVHPFWRYDARAPHPDTPAEVP